MKRDVIVIALFFVLAAAGCTALPEKTRVLTAPYADNELALSHRFIPIEEGSLYTSSEPSEEMLRWLLKEKGVKTFVSLKGRIAPAKEAIIRQGGASLVVFSWSRSFIPPVREIEAALLLMNDRGGQSVAIFCTGGVDRTGFLRAYYRLSFQGWSLEDALAEFYGNGHFPSILDEHLKKTFGENTKQPRK